MKRCTQHCGSDVRKVSLSEVSSRRTKCTFTQVRSEVRICKSLGMDRYAKIISCARDFLGSFCGSPPLRIRQTRAD